MTNGYHSPPQSKHDALREDAVAQETLARMFWERVEQRRDRPAQLVKVGGAWKEVSWRELGDEVRELALGLIALGRQQGDRVGLLSQTRAEWVRADFAIFSAGAVTIPVYPSYPAEGLAYIVNDSEVKTLFVEDAPQLGKALEGAKEMPGLQSIVLVQGDVGEAGAAAGGGKLRLLDWAGL